MSLFFKKSFFLVLVIFASVFSVFSNEAKNVDSIEDDIFANQKIEDGDFYKIVIEPSKNELKNEISKNLENLKKKKLEVLKKVEGQKKNIGTAKEKQMSQIAKSKANILNKKTNGGKSVSAKTQENKKESVSSNTQKKENETEKKENLENLKKKNENQKKINENLKKKSETQKKSSESQKKTNENQEKIDSEFDSEIDFEIEEDFENDVYEEKEREIDSSIDMRKVFINSGMEYKGIQYVWGGKTPRPGFDCSGLISYTAKQSLGIDLKGNAQDIYNQTVPISLSEAQPGDLVFFKGAGDSRITHVGIYLGNNPGENDFGKQNLFLNAASSGPRTGVIISGLNENYWKKTYYGCGRIFPEI